MLSKTRNASVSSLIKTCISYRSIDLSSLFICHKSRKSLLKSWSSSPLDETKWRGMAWSEIRYQRVRFQSSYWKFSTSHQHSNKFQIRQAHSTIEVDLKLRVEYRIKCLNFSDMFWARFEVKQIEFLFKQRSKRISMSLTTKLETGLNSTSAAEKSGQ